MKKLLSVVIVAGLSCSIGAAPFGQAFDRGVTISELKARLEDKKNLTKLEYKNIQRQIKELEKSAKKTIDPNDFKSRGLQKRS